ncbi:MAG: hypothetical protein D6713_05740 [Deltaproteobacteria bacterium]|nr:MAG: hypothetical protein D6713_05740 [Deltaproteobacteria bacterium]
MKTGRIIAIVLTALLFTHPPSSLAGEGIHVVTTISPLRTFVNILLRGVPDVRIDLLIPDGSDPHSFSLTPSRALLLTRADIVVGNGGAEEVLDFAKVRDLAGERLLLTLPLLQKEGLTGRNPHTWLSPKASAREVEIIGERLSRLLPGETARIRGNASFFRKEMESALEEMKERLGGKKICIVSLHGAFDLLARDLGIPVAGRILPGHGVPPSPRHLVSLAEKARSLGNPVVVVDSPAGRDAAESFSRLADIPAVEASPFPPDVDNPGEYRRWLVQVVEKITGL